MTAALFGTTVVPSFLGHLGSTEARELKYSIIFCCGRGLFPFFILQNIYLRKRSIFKLATNLCFQMTKLKTLSLKTKATKDLLTPTSLPHEFLAFEVPEMLKKIDKKSQLCNFDSPENTPSLVVNISGSCLSSKVKLLSFFLNKPSLHPLTAVRLNLLIYMSNKHVYMYPFSPISLRRMEHISYILLYSQNLVQNLVGKRFFCCCLLLLLLLIRFTKHLLLCKALC